MKFLIALMLVGLVGCMAQPIQITTCRDSCGMGKMKEVTFSKCECK